MSPRAPSRTTRIRPLADLAPVDILELIDNLNGVRVPALLLNQCDIDRSNLCAPADILSEIDLLNGANGWPVQNGKSLPICASAP